MAKVVFLLGAGFNCSILDPRADKVAPLARNFFQVFLTNERFGAKESLEAFDHRVAVNVLFEEIKRYWHLDLEGLRTQDLDIEECLTLFESKVNDDATATEDKVRLQRASIALSQMLFTYLSDLRPGGHTPTAAQFGHQVLTSGADVLTLNYDSLAEEAIALASGIGPKPAPDFLRQKPGTVPIPDGDLDASHFNWRPQLAYGFEFDEVPLPIAGSPLTVEGARYYGHRNNTLYGDGATRVLKLHGSIDWLRYTGELAYPHFAGATHEPWAGIVLERNPNFWFGESPSRDGWRMTPMVIPPLLYKSFEKRPFPAIWEAALQTLSECETLVVIGYSFAPTDFRTRRLFLEAFSEHRLRDLIVINPNPTVAGIVRALTHFSGGIVTCDDLRAFYGLPESFFDFTEAANQPG